MRRSAAGLTLLALVLGGCAASGGFEEVDAGIGGEPVSHVLAAEGGILAYGQECAAAIAAVPVFDCRDGALAAITVDGVEPAPGTYQPDMDCDRPALLPTNGEKTDGHCVPGSRAIMWEDSTTQIAGFCRQKLIRPADTFLFDEIDIIAHSVTSGQTCWFQAKANNPNGDPSIGLDGRRVPPPNEVTPPPGFPPAATFWHAPEVTASEQCGSCHDADPFYYSPFVAQTGQLPADPFGKYANDIGEAFQRWPAPQSLEPRGNTCTGCHRIGTSFTCGQGALETVGRVNSPGLDPWAARYPQSHWMPAGNALTKAQWDVIYGESVEQLTSCCANPSGEGCHISAITGG